MKFGEHSLFQDTGLRCLEVSDISDIFVVTNETQKFYTKFHIQELGYKLPEENLLIDPEGKNTLPAICFVMKEIEHKYGKSTVGVFSSEHMMAYSAMQTIAEAEALA